MVRCSGLGVTVRPPQAERRCCRLFPRRVVAARHVAAQNVARSRARPKR